MIKSFRDKRTQALFDATHPPGVPPDVIKRAAAKLDMIDGVSSLEDLREPRGNRFHALKGDRLGQYSIAVNT